jgi:hypothetical protein
MNMERHWIIYTLADPRTGEIRYVGMTFRKRQRLNEHVSRAATGGRTHRDCWIKSLLDAGLRPTLAVAQEGRGDGWQDAERSWIAGLRESGRLVNHTDGGEGLPGYVPTPELREKWSAMRKGVKYSPGRVGAMKGRSHTPEARAKIAKAATSRPHTDQSKAKLSAARKGKPLSAEHRRKLSEAKAGRTLPAEHRRKIAASTTSRKAVLAVESGVVYPSVTAAAAGLGASKSSVNQAIRKGCFCKGNHLRYA